MSLLKADTIKPVSSSGDLSLQGDSGGSAVDCLNITSAGDINFSGNTDAKIKLPSAGGIYESDGSTAILTESGGAVTLDNVTLGSSVTGAGGLYVSIAIICDQKPSNTSGGSFAYGGWRTRELNTEISDADGIVSISSDRFTLAAGTYTVEWSAPFVAVSENQTKLYIAATTTTVQMGSSEFGDPPSAYGAGRSVGIAVISPGSSTAYEIQHYCYGPTYAHGFGRALGQDVEIYTIVKIVKHS